MDASLTQPDRVVETLHYLSGFGNEHATEALAGALPVGRNSPKKPPLGLYAEQLNGTAFTAPRNENRRTWLYRIRPAVCHDAMAMRAHRDLMTGPTAQGGILEPNRLGWDPWPIPTEAQDFVEGMVTIAVNGDAKMHTGIGIHVYVTNAPMKERVFSCLDGELLITPQEGGLRITTELGLLTVEPGEICLIPRGVKFSVALSGVMSRGFVCENYGAHFRLPELGPIGANGLANARDFLVPVAAFEDRENPVESVVKFGGALWTTILPWSPFDVVAWHGTHAPAKYDLGRFMAVNAVRFDHADPSIFTVLHAPSGIAGVANVDFVVFPPRWHVTQETFRPPYFHRNVMAEFTASIGGGSQTRSQYLPGSFTVRNPMAAHGPDVAHFERGSDASDSPAREEALSIMFESRLPLCLTQRAREAPNRLPAFDSQWRGMPKRFQIPG